MMFLDEDSSCFSRLGDSIRELFIPTSVRRALQAQQRLFKTFVVSPVQHKRFSLRGGGALNYVDILGADHEYRSNHMANAIGGGRRGGGRPTLVLMHGYGAGEPGRVGGFMQLDDSNRFTGM